MVFSLSGRFVLTDGCRLLCVFTLFLGIIPCRACHSRGGGGGNDDYSSSTSKTSRRTCTHTVENAALDLVRLVREQFPAKGKEKGKGEEGNVHHHHHQNNHNCKADENDEEDVYLDGLVGHSLGGKVAMQYLLHVREEKEKEKEKEKENHVQVLLPRSSAWILDSVPTRVEKGTVMQDTERILHLLSGLELSLFETQSQVMKYLEGQGVSAPTAMWLCSNLVREKRKKKKMKTREGKGTEEKEKETEVKEEEDVAKDQAQQLMLRWKFDLHGAKELFESFQQTDCLDVLRHPPTRAEGKGKKEVQIHLVRAENSFRLHGLQEKLKDFPIYVHTLRNAGHWVHVDNPKGLLKMMIENST